jgi:hypothetical protein
LDYFDSFRVYGTFPQVCKGFRDFLASLARRGDIYARHALHVIYAHPHQKNVELAAESLGLDVIAVAEHVGQSESSPNRLYECTVFGEFHSVNGGIAAINAYTIQYVQISWYHRGFLHRDDEPARIYHGKLEEGENFIDTSDDEEFAAAKDIRRASEWYNHGQMWRANDLPTRVYGDGRKEWHNAARKLHRDGDAPAVIEHKPNILSWYVDGERHRAGGLPAKVYISGFCTWYEGGSEYARHYQAEEEEIYEIVWDAGLAPFIPIVNLYEETNSEHIRELIDGGTIVSAGDIDNETYDYEPCMIVYQDLYDLYYA